MKVYDIECLKCGMVHLDYFLSQPDSWKCQCGSIEHKILPVATKSYSIDAQGTSTSPKSKNFKEIKTE